MRVGVPVETKDGLRSRVSRHFGRARYLAILDVSDDEVTSIDFVELPESHGPGDLPALAAREGVNVMVTYGIGRRAIERFAAMGVEVVPGVTGSIGDVINGLTKGTLERDDDWIDVIRKERGRYGSE